MFDDAQPWPQSVVGWRCTHCDEPVVEGESGLVMTHVRQGEDGKPVGAPGAVHRECWTRAIFGSVQHLEGRCGVCNGADPGGPHVHPDDEVTYREQARAVMDYLSQHGKV